MPLENARRECRRPAQATPLWTIIDTIVFLDRCSPVDSIWEHAASPHCYYSIAAMNVNHYIQTGMNPECLFVIYQWLIYE